MLASEVIARYENFCPPGLSLPGDTVGLQIGTLDKVVRKVMVALDVREQTVAEAIAEGVDLIIVKHAPIFRPIKNLVADDAQKKRYIDLIKNDIAVYVSHSNIDVVDGGLNDWFCDILGIEDRTYLSETMPGFGIGRVGDIEPMRLGDFATKVKMAFHLDHLRLVAYDADSNQTIERVAICGGSAHEFYPDAIEKGADIFITGDIYYHDAQDMLSDGLLGLDPGHHIEVLFVKKVADLLREWKEERDWDIEIVESQANTNPFKAV